MISRLLVDCVVMGSTHTRTHYVDPTYHTHAFVPLPLPPGDFTPVLHDTVYTAFLRGSLRLPVALRLILQFCTSIHLYVYTFCGYGYTRFTRTHIPRAAVLLRLHTTRFTGTFYV